MANKAAGRTFGLVLGGLALALTVTGVAWLAAARRLPGMSGAGGSSIASAPVIKGDFEITLKTRGEMKALRSEIGRAHV